MMLATLRILRADRRPASPFGYQLSPMAIDAAAATARTLLGRAASLAAAAPQRREAPLAAHLVSPACPGQPRHRQPEEPLTAVATPRFFSMQSSSWWYESQNDRTPSRSRSAVTSARSIPAACASARVRLAPSGSASTVGAT